MFMAILFKFIIYIIYIINGTLLCLVKLVELFLGELFL